MNVGRLSSSLPNIVSADMIPLSLSLSAPARRLTQETVSTAREQRDRHTKGAIVLHPSALHLLLPQYP